MNYKTRPLPPHIPITGLKKGDILLFRSLSAPTSDMKLIMFLQSLSRKKFGHKETTHTATVVGIDEKGQPIIGHVTEKGEEGKPGYELGYVKEPLQDLLKRDNDRSFIIYRPTNTGVAQAIGNAADNVEDLGIKWEHTPGARALFNISTLNPNRKINLNNEKPLSISTICSKFTIESMKRGAKSLIHKSNSFFLAKDIPGYPHIASSSTPKTLEDHLFQRKDYDRFCYLGSDSVSKMMDVIMRELVKGKLVRNSKEDNSRINKMLDISNMTEINETEKCVALLKLALPILNRGKIFFHTRAYNNVMKEARGQGIFEEQMKEEGTVRDGPH